MNPIELLTFFMSWLRPRKVLPQDYFYVTSLNKEGFMELRWLSSKKCKSLKIEGHVNLKAIEAIGSTRLSSGESIRLRVDFMSSFIPQPKVTLNWWQGVSRFESTFEVHLPPQVY